VTVEDNFLPYANGRVLPIDEGRQYSRTNAFKTSGSPTLSH